MIRQFFIVVLFQVVTLLWAFQYTNVHRNVLVKTSSLKMVYIPEGLTKAQWEAIQKKEAEEKKVWIFNLIESLLLGR